MKKPILWLSVLIVLLAIFASGCHSETMEGVGRDVQKVGKKIEG